MNLKYVITLFLLLLLNVVVPMSSVAEPSPPSRGVNLADGYATPEEAATALVTAVRSQEVSRMVAVIGPASRAWLSSGDAVADRHEWERFVTAYDRKHAINRVGERRALLVVGDDDWPFPAPLVQRGERWHFDAVTGGQELLNRRIGRNELDTIQTLLAIVDAQREYAAGDLDGNGANDYARRFISTPGKRDGLFWPVTDGQPPSPLGSLVGAAAREGYGTHDPNNRAYHGYFYRILTGQGKVARGGAFGYLVKDRLLGGFAVLAQPAKYGVSGIMTFIVNHDGEVYQQNLGPRTETVARKIQTFNPDSGWRKVD